MTPETLALEMAYTTWEGSCKDPSPDLRECRRPHGHDGDHASGHGAGLRTWCDPLLHPSHTNTKG